MAFTTTGSNLIINGSFEDVTGATSTAFGFTGMGLIVGWTDANGDNLDIHQDERNGILPTDGIGWLDMAGSPNLIDVSQSVAGIEDGATYQLSFDLGQPSDIETDDNGLEVYWNGELIATVNAATGVMQTLNFTLIGGAGDGSNTLRFVGTDNGATDNVGSSLDNVQLALVLDLENDETTVNEDEASGDVDLNALSNDAGDTLVVAEVNGSAANVGVSVDGSNGGSFVINADGTVDFDADGSDAGSVSDFDGLGANESAVTSVTYTIESPNPFDAGSQSAVTSAEVGAGDQNAFFTLTAGEFTNDGTTPISGSINLDGITQPTYNILFVMDVSGSTDDGANVFPGVGDLNNDGQTNDIIDAQIAGFRQLSNELDSLGFDDTDLQIGLVTFESAGSGDTEIVTGAGGADSFNAGSTALDNALNVGAVGGGTDFEAALQLAITWFGDQPVRDNNIIFFLSDGVPFDSGVFTDEAATLQDPNGLNTQINAVGVTSASSLTDLNLIDNTVAAGQTAGSSAEQITTIAQLNAALSPPLLAANIVDFRVFVDGVEDTSFDTSDLTPAGTGFDINPQALSGLVTAANASSAIVAEVEFDDGTVLRNTLSVQTPAEETATVSVTVTGINDGPDAVNDAFSVAEDGSQTVAILANDSDADTNDVLSVLSVQDPINGTVVVNPNGTVTYTPDADFTGTDAFSYTVSDGNGVTDTATITATVTPVADGPEAGDDTVSVTEDGSVTTPVLDNDTDADGDTLTVLSVTDPANGTAVVNPDGTVTYTPDPDFNGTDVYTYTVSDGTGATDTATVSVTVDPVADAPVAGADTVLVDEDGSVTTPVLDNDTDPDGDTLTVLSVTDPANGTTVVNPDGTVTYTPDPDFNGTDVYTYTVSDGTGSTDTATVSVTVDAVNDDPTAGDDTGSVLNDETTTIAVLDNDSDVDADTLTVASVSATSGGGTVSINLDGTIEYDPGTAFDSLNTGESAIDTFTYLVTDGAGGSDTATVSVSVTGVNTPPVANDDDVTTTNDASQVFDLTSNDSDPDGDDLEIISVDSTGVQGLVFIGSDFDSIFYDPNGAFDGLSGSETAIETLTYTIDDGNGATSTATVSITVSNGNTDPSVTGDTATVDQGQSVDVDVLANDSDADGDTLSVLSVTDGANGTVTNNGNDVTYTPDPSFPGQTDSFTYTVTDGNGGTATETVTVTVNPNFPPFIPEPVVYFAPENQTFAANIPVIDLENDAVTYSLAGTGTDDALFEINGTTGTLTFLTAPDFEAPGDSDADNRYDVDITVADPFNATTQTITINVTDVDDTPNEAPEITEVPALGGAFAIGGGPNPDRVDMIINPALSGVLADVNAADSDAGDSLIFSLFGEDADLFDLNVITGEITLGQPLSDPRGSFDGDATYELDVLVEDGNGGQDIVEVDFLLITGA